MATIVEDAGVPMPPHCPPMIQEARDNLDGDTEAQRAQDGATIEAYDRAHGYAENRDPGEELEEKLLGIARLHPPGEPPQSMIAALALALYGQEEADNGQC